MLDGYSDWYYIRFLYQHFGWWGIPMYLGLIFVTSFVPAFVRALHR